LIGFKRDPGFTRIFFVLARKKAQEYFRMPSIRVLKERRNTARAEKDCKDRMILKLINYYFGNRK